jgi:hypothetical protein
MPGYQTAVLREVLARRLQKKIIAEAQAKRHYPRKLKRNSILDDDATVVRAARRSSKEPNKIFQNGFRRMPPAVIIYDL